MKFRAGQFLFYRVRNSGGPLKAGEPVCGEVPQLRPDEVVMGQLDGPPYVERDGVRIELPNGWRLPQQDLDDLYAERSRANGGRKHVESRVVERPALPPAESSDEGRGTNNAD